MKEFSVTEYMIHYMEQNHMESKKVASETGISKEKLTKGYQEPLFADEFLTLCVYFGIRPEEVAKAMKIGDNRQK